MSLVRSLARWSRIPAACTLLASSSAAQGDAPAATSAPFEGVVTMRMRSPQLPAEGMTMRYYVRAGALRTEMEVGGRTFAYTLVDPSRREMYSVMPEQQAYMATPVPDSAAIAAMIGARPATPPSVTKLGRRETVAGQACEQYRVVADTLDVESCIATDFPMVIPNFARGAAATPVPNGMPKGLLLKMTPKGAAHPLLEVVRIERRSLDAALFELPAGYTRMEPPPGMLPRP